MARTAMELTPSDPLPVALAAWCHRQARRPSLHLAARCGADWLDPLPSERAKTQYRQPADRNAARRRGIHAGVSSVLRRMCTLSARSCWTEDRRGPGAAAPGSKRTGERREDAIKLFKIAQALCKNEASLNFLCAIGVGAAHFEAARYKPAIRRFRRGLAEHPTAVWNNRFLAPAHVSPANGGGAGKRWREFAQTYPDLTIAEVRTGLPYSPGFLDRVREKGWRASGCLFPKNSSSEGMLGSRKFDQRDGHGAAQQGLAGLPLGGGVEGFEELHLAAGE